MFHSPIFDIEDIPLQIRNFQASLVDDSNDVSNNSTPLSGNIKDIFFSDYWVKSKYGYLSRLYLLFKHMEIMGIVDINGNFI